jgi:hypothetical protein
MRYTKETPRLVVKFIDSDTDTVLFELKDRTWMNVGEILTDYAVDSIMKNEWKNKKVPQNLMVLVVSEYQLK